MKVCPQCHKTYTDENLNFCLEDGSVLQQAAGGGAMPETVLLNQPRITAPTPMAPSMQIAQPAWNTNQPQYASAAPQRSSKTWIWVALILGVLVLVCGGGAAGFVVFLSMQNDKAPVATNNNPNPGPNQGPLTPTTRTKTTKVDLEKWVRNSKNGITSFDNGEFVMASNQADYYYVLMGPDDLVTTGANTKVTVRNVSGAATDLGYGIVFHGNPKTPLDQDYAFLLDAASQKYRVVHHSPNNEDNVVGWTKSDAIVGGTGKNTLEVHDLTGKIELLINGTMVTSITNTYGFPKGIVGLYSGDGLKAAFSDLEIDR